MNMRKTKHLLAGCIFFFLCNPFVNGQQTGKISGTLLDASNNDPLYFANISIMGSSIGGVSNEEGFFTITNVPAGEHQLSLQYVGYKSVEVTVTVKAGEVTDIGTHRLEFEPILGEEVVVTGILRGQAAAINQQVKSNTIVNVVSREKIQEVPDVNAAESLSRLPGITISRSGGEGAKVTIRGVSPRFNSVTVNGQSMPSTDVNNRSINLSMISSDLLDGIEVYKAITPDMDGDAVGGTVNLVTKTADEGFHGAVNVESGYHSLTDGIGTYRGSFALSNRFLDNKLGIIVGANYHRSNRNVDYYEGDYELTGDGGYRGNNAEFTNRLETRDRFGINGAIDFKFKTGKIVLDHMTSQTTRDIIERRMRARPTISVIELSYNKQDNTLNLNSTNLRGEFELFDRMDVNFNLGRAKTFNDIPLNYGTGADMENGLTPEANEAQPLDMFRYANFVIDDFYGGEGVWRNHNNVEDENYTAQLDVKIPFSFNIWFSGNLKFGGKIRQKHRVRENVTLGIQDYLVYLYEFRNQFPDYERNGNVYSTSNFIDQDYTGYDSPFEDHNDIPYVFDPDIVEMHYETMTEALDTVYKRQVQTYFDEYDAFERIGAGYIMAEIRLGSRLTFIPGFRYENTFLEYTGAEGTQRENEQYRLTKTDTTASNTTGIFLPMFHLKYDFLKGLSLRLAATKTLSRPDFINLTPFTHRYYKNQKIVRFGSIDLKIPTAWNYDAILTWYSKYGLFSVGGFYKEIYDIDIKADFFDWSGTLDTNPWYGWKVNSPINLDTTSTVYGIEFDIQTNLRFLPKPFDGIVLGGNYSIMKSETFYPFYYVDYPPPDYFPATADSFRAESIQGQADFIANFTVGYEKGPFSGRISMNYQGVKFSKLGNTQFQDEFDDKYIRWDAALTYKFGEHWQVLMHLVNISNETERKYIYTEDQTSRIEQYGWQANLGVRYRF